MVKNKNKNKKKKKREGKMIDTAELRIIMKNQGYRDEQLAEAIGLSQSEFSDRMSEGGLWIG